MSTQDARNCLVVNHPATKKNMLACAFLISKLALVSWFKTHQQSMLSIVDFRCARQTASVCTHEVSCIISFNQVKTIACFF